MRAHRKPRICSWLVLFVVGLFVVNMGRDRMPPRIDARVIERLYRTADAARWQVPLDAFADALERSVTKRFAGAAPTSSEIQKYLDSLHVADVALACACAAGHEAAWEHFILEQRPGLYRAAESIDRSGGGRELADSLYAELYGLRESDSGRQSLFRYFHGRSSLATWLRAVLTQRHIDAVRARARLEPLPEDAEVVDARTTREDTSAERAH